MVAAVTVRYLLDLYVVDVAIMAAVVRATAAMNAATNTRATGPTAAQLYAYSSEWSASL